MHRHLLNYLVGILFLLFMLEEVGYFVLAGMVVPYLFMTLLPHAFVTSIIFSIAYVLLVHSYRSMYPYANSWSHTRNGGPIVQFTS